MNAELSEYFRENLYTIIVIWIVLGLVFAATVLFVGTRRGKRNLGVIGAIVTLVLSILSPALGLISAAVFVSIILIKSGRNSGDEVPDSTNS